MASGFGSPRHVASRLVLVSGAVLQCLQKGIDVSKFVITKDVLPRWHALRRPALMHGLPECRLHIVAVSLFQQTKIDTPLALDGVRAVTVRAGAVEQLLSRSDVSGCRLRLCDFVLRRLAHGNRFARSLRRDRFRLGKLAKSDRAGVWHSIFYKQPVDVALQARKHGVDLV